MTPAQHAWLMYLATGDRLWLFQARVTSLTKDAYLAQDWTAEDENGQHVITTTGRLAANR